MEMRATKCTRHGRLRLLKEFALFFIFFERNNILIFHYFRAELQVLHVFHKMIIQLTLVKIGLQGLPNMHVYLCDALTI